MQPVSQIEGEQSPEQGRYECRQTEGDGHRCPPLNGLLAGTISHGVPEIQIRPSAIRPKPCRHPREPSPRSFETQLCILERRCQRRVQNHAMILKLAERDGGMPPCGEVPPCTQRRRHENGRLDFVQTAFFNVIASTAGPNCARKACASTSCSKQYRMKAVPSAIAPKRSNVPTRLSRKFIISSSSLRLYPVGGGTTST